MFSNKQIQEYGKAHGYSPKEIAQVSEQAKNNIINYCNNVKKIISQIELIIK